MTLDTIKALFFYLGIPSSGGALIIWWLNRHRPPDAPRRFWLSRLIRWVAQISSANVRLITAEQNLADTTTALKTKTEEFETQRTDNDRLRADNRRLRADRSFYERGTASFSGSTASDGERPPPKRLPRTRRKSPALAAGAPPATSGPTSSAAEKIEVIGHDDGPHD
jgi:hypothetical protein